MMMFINGLDRRAIAFPLSSCTYHYSLKFTQVAALSIKIFIALGFSLRIKCYYFGVLGDEGNSSLLVSYSSQYIDNSINVIIVYDNSNKHKGIGNGRTGNQYI